MYEKIGDIFSSLLKLNTEFYKNIETYDGYIELITGLTESLDHRTFIKYEIASDIVRFDINYMFGSIYKNKELSAKDFNDILRMNFNTFMMTSCFLAINEIDGFEYTFLRSCQPFLLNWPSDEIAEMLNLMLHDIMTGLGAGVRWPNAINPFQPNS